MKDRAGRSKVEILLRAGDRVALDRYCAFKNLTMTQFFTNRVREYDRRVLRQLTDEQRERYRDGDLIFTELSEEQRHAPPRPAALHVETDERLDRLCLLAGGAAKSDLIASTLRVLENSWLTSMSDAERQRYINQKLGPEDIAAIRRRRRGPDPEPAPEPDPEPRLDPELAKLFSPELEAAE
jgi:hypothetical protein